MITEVIQKPTHGSIDWLELRHRDAHGRCVFGTSELASLMNASPYKNRADLFVSKRTTPKVKPMTSVFYRGHLLEPVLLAEASKRLGVPLDTPNVMFKRDRLIGTLDGADNENNPRLIVEAKTTTRYRVRDVEDLPVEWLWQAWGQQYLCPEASVIFVVFDRDQEISLVTAPRNIEALDAIEHEIEVFGSAVDSGDDPEPQLLEAMDAEQIAASFTVQKTSIELPSEAARWIEELDVAKAMIAQGKQLEKYARDEIARHLCGNEIGTIGGKKAVTWSLVNGRLSLDTEALKTDLPDVYEKYQRRGEPFRTMRIAKQQQSTEGEQQ